MSGLHTDLLSTQWEMPNFIPVGLNEGGLGKAGILSGITSICQPFHIRGPDLCPQPSLQSALLALQPRS